MPRYFGFEAVGVLVYNAAREQLFSDPESQIPEDDDKSVDNQSEDAKAGDSPSKGDGDNANATPRKLNDEQNQETGE